MFGTALPSAAMLRFSSSMRLSSRHDGSRAPMTIAVGLRRAFTVIIGSVRVFAASRDQARTTGLWRSTSARSSATLPAYPAFSSLSLSSDRDTQSWTVGPGRKALVQHWLRQRDEGVNHVALNMKPLRRPFSEAIDELADHVLPVFSV